MLAAQGTRFIYLLAFRPLHTLFFFVNSRSDPSVFTLIANPPPRSRRERPPSAFQSSLKKIIKDVGPIDMDGLSYDTVDNADESGGAHDHSEHMERDYTYRHNVKRTRPVSSLRPGRRKHFKSPQEESKYSVTCVASISPSYFSLFL